MQTLPQAGVLLRASSERAARNDDEASISPRGRSGYPAVSPRVRGSNPRAACAHGPRFESGSEDRECSPRTWASESALPADRNRRCGTWSPRVLTTVSMPVHSMSDSRLRIERRPTWRKGRLRGDHWDSPILRRSREGLGYAIIPDEDPDTTRGLLGEDTLDAWWIATCGIGCDCASLCKDGVSGVANGIIKSRVFQVTAVFTILANAIIIGFETDDPGNHQWVSVELGFLIFFFVELVLRILASGPRAFFCGVSVNSNDTVEKSLKRRRTTLINKVVAAYTGQYVPIAPKKKAQEDDNPDVLWNLFDCSLVVTGGLACFMTFLCEDPTTMHIIGTHSGAFRIIRLCRLLRVLRVLRVLRFLRQLYLLAYGFIEGAVAVFWVAVLTGASIYTCSIVLVPLYGRAQPGDPFEDFFQENFSTVFRCMFTLFQIIASPTLGPYAQVVEHYPLLLCFIVVFVMFGSFGITGLLTGVISESIINKNTARIEEQRAEREKKRKMLELSSADLFDEIDTLARGSIAKGELAPHKEAILHLFASAGVAFPCYDLDHMFTIMDWEDTGFVGKEEFVTSIIELCDEVRPMSIMELHVGMARCQSRFKNIEGALETLLQGCKDAASHSAAHSEQQVALIKSLYQMNVQLPKVDRSLKLQETCEHALSELRSLMTAALPTAPTCGAMKGALPGEEPSLANQGAATGFLPPITESSYSPNRRSRSASPKDPVSPRSSGSSRARRGRSSPGGSFQALGDSCPAQLDLGCVGQPRIDHGNAAPRHAADASHPSMGAAGSSAGAEAFRAHCRARLVDVRQHLEEAFAAQQALMEFFVQRSPVSAAESVQMLPDLAEVAATMASLSEGNAALMCQCSKPFSAADTPSIRGVLVGAGPRRAGTGSEGCSGDLSTLTGDAGSGGSGETDGAPQPSGGLSGGSGSGEGTVLAGEGGGTTSQALGSGGGDTGGSTRER